MNIKKLIGLLTALVMLVSLCQFSFAAEPSSTEILIGENQYLDYTNLDADLNGRVNQYRTDSAIPYNARYTNGFYVQGAQVRTDYPLGLRFIIVYNTNIKAEMTAAELKNIVYGALVDYDTNLLLTLENATAVDAKNFHSENTNARTQKYNICITDIPEANLRSEIYVRPYVKYTDLDGVDRVLYGEQYSCDIYSAAYTAYTYGGENDVEDILSKIKDKNGTNPCGDGYLISADDPIIEDLRNQADAQISKIKHSTNMSPANATGTVYYVSSKNGKDTNDGKSPSTAWKTLGKVNNADLQPGDYVLFERGSLFRADANLSKEDDGTMAAFYAKEGVTYSAYGTGEKPIICVSPESGAVESRWTEVADNIWMYSPKTDRSFWNDIGSIAFTDSKGNEFYANKWLIFKDSTGQLVEYKSKTVCPEEGIYTALQEDLDFLHFTHHYTTEEYDNKYAFNVFLYSEENPATRFTSIEFLQKKHGILLSGDNITIDNLCIKYAGAHGIQGARNNITVSNCEFSFIGGSVQGVKTNSTTGAETPTRFGNGVEVYGRCDNFTVKNCYFYQIYDAAVTHQYDFGQGSTSTTDISHKNVTFKNNVMEYCTYSIEFFLANVPTNNTSVMDNILYEGNHMWYCGEGFGSQRKEKTDAAHIKGWPGNMSHLDNFVIKNNIVALSKHMLLQANLVHKNKLTSDGIKLINNTFVGKYGQKFGMLDFWVDVNTMELYDYNIKNYLNTRASGSGLYKYSLSHNDQFYFILD